MANAIAMNSVSFSIYTYKTSLWLIRRFRGEKRRGLANPQPTQVEHSLSILSSRFSFLSSLVSLLSSLFSHLSSLFSLLSSLFSLLSSLFSLPSALCSLLSALCSLLSALFSLLSPLSFLLYPLSCPLLSSLLFLTKCRFLQYNMVRGSPCKNEGRCHHVPAFTIY